MFEKVILTKLNDHTWMMDENHEATGYIVVGSKKALVVDTMIGGENLYDIVRTVTDLPIMVVNTHGHPDHIYGNIYFDEAYLNEADYGIAEFHSNHPEFVAEIQKMGRKMPPFKNIKDGDVIDLGGLTLDVVGLAGHTKGGICLYLREDRVLFTGDAFNHQIWYQLEESLTLKEILANIEKIDDVISKSDRILHGHAQGYEDISLIGRIKKGLKELIEQEGSSVTDADGEYRWFGGVHKQHRFDDDGSIICYREDNIR